jgi:poly-gamma-glutamate capsule biosynthesis protein CapA/YwtB (metallophosphatase superfamily)
VGWVLASCGLSDLPALTATLQPSATLTASAQISPVPLATGDPTPTATPPPTPKSSPTPTASPRPSPTPSPTPVGTPTSGEPWPLSLGWRLDANSHLTGVVVNASCEGGAQSGSNEPAFFLASLGRTVYALDRHGNVAWQAHLPGPIYALAFVGAGDQPGSLAVAGDNGVTLLSMQGRRLWYRDLGTRITALESGFTCSGQGAGLLAGGWDQQLTSLDGKGNVLWQADLGAPVGDILWLAEEKVAVAATLDGELWAFDQSGKEVWRFLVGPGVPITGLEPLPAVTESPTDDDSTALLVGLQDGRLVALDIGADLNPSPSGMPSQEAGGEPRVRWQQALGEGGPVWHTANVNGDAEPEIIVGTGGDTPQLALVSTAGELAWRVALPSPVNAVIVLEAEGGTAILAGLASGEIQSYDDQGRLRASVHAGLSVWHLAAYGGNALALADVVAWQIVPGAGPAGSPWLKTPALAPLSTGIADPQAASPEGTAVIVFLGDVVPGRSMEAQLARYGPAYPWGGLGSLLRQADLAVANLESVLTTQGQPLNKRYIIRAHPNSGQTLIEAGFDLVSLANNHALDYGQVGLDETLSTLDALGIAAVGVGCETSTDENPPSGDSCQAGRPAVFTLNGVKVAVLGYAGAYWNGSPDMPASDRIAWADPARVQADVRAARDQADVVIVLLHAGVEYAAEPSPNQVAVAHAAIDAGADLVVGHHPHVTQTVERYNSQNAAEGSGRDGLIVYSLGNAVFDIPRQAAMQGDLLRVYVTRGGLQRAELWPFWIEDAIRPRLLAGDSGSPRFSIIFDQ